MTGDASDEVLVERRGAAGLLTLNRPKALNALDLGMVRRLRAALDAWGEDPGVTRIVLRGTGRAFCAGGDLRRIHDIAKAAGPAAVDVFWREEYALNTLIHRYPKPIVSLIDGIVMGGGVGLSLHGSNRVAGERYAFAMPEVSIGFFPDVGATYALPRLPGAFGTYLALTGERVGPGDGLAFGLATHAVPAASFEAITETLAAGGPVEEALEQAPGHDAPPPGPLHAARALIDACFSAESVAAVLARLDAAAAQGSDFAARTAATIRTRSPTSLAVAFAQMRRGGSMSFPEAMLTEYRIVTRILQGHDFYEGVRAVIIDKHGAPRWQPDSLDAVAPAAVEAYFAPLPDEPRFG
ncbi:enoyl-CoA hydratase/isomerase family protein [Methylobacterium nodulans]|uniref:3-hydroxyisobutyryl-CoA hydrolase n=1 Tax=Methylobacterium nodulans (strain LMG 21967 / CNCM I-2342 / ORS 2060) TaxID=460265 RepID=B8IPL3_METNO|nr:enoyl-CoA hydratase/isomerase family protein [Methylobacterium nodulans]ACL62305.1 Enoyl-CoA hydratase/isomerase [Methylobacterium nodulans ORS 2060]